MSTALYRLFLALALLLPMAAHASDASDFVAANPLQQAKLLESWAAQPDPARVELINSLQQGEISVDGAPPQPVRLNNRLRGLIETAVAAQQLLAADAKVRLGAARELQKSAKPAQLGFLDRQLAGETDADVHA
ncbi:urea ABC transporter permease subunit UrtB, partial [Pseudomonas gingeri]|nr:urea ABC transporter permease subunit UrtB [Pseudomonas gingeri]